MRDWLWADIEKAAPRPWHLNNGGREIQDDKGRIVVRAFTQYREPGMADASLAFIVNAVNAFVIPNPPGPSSKGE